MNRNRNLRSAIQFYNASAQPIAATNLISNPLQFALGNKVTDTGSAIELDAFGIDIESSGLYRISADIDVAGIAAGDITFALTLDGQIMPETIRVITMVANITKVFSIETIRSLGVCCSITDHNISVIAYSDGTATGTVTRLSGNAIKLA